MCLCTYCNLKQTSFISFGHLLLKLQAFLLSPPSSAHPTHSGRGVNSTELSGKDDSKILLPHRSQISEFLCFTYSLKSDNDTLEDFGLRWRSYWWFFHYLSLAGLAPKCPNRDQYFGLRSSVTTEQEDTTHGLRSLQSKDMNRFKINTVCKESNRWAMVQ